MNVLLTAQLERALSEAKLSDNDKNRAIRDALKTAFPAYYPWVRDVYSEDGLVVFELEGRSYTPAGAPAPVTVYPSGLYRMGFTVGADSAVTLTGEPQRVTARTVYDPEPPADMSATEALAEVLAVLTSFQEAGRVLSAANEKRLRAALAELQSVLAGLPAQESAADPAPEPEADAIEADLELTGDLVPLVEKAVRSDGTVQVKVIQPGWGSSGYYSEAMLKRDGPKVFNKGTKMYLDHPTEAEDAARPERSVRDLAGELTSSARYLAEGPAGPGLYADAKVFPPFAEVLDQIAPSIGVSIRALGKATAGEAEGRQGPIIEQLVSARSVDYVTQAGAGGKVLSLMESARGRGPVEKEADMSELQEALARLKALEEAEAARGQEIAALKQENARLKERNLLSDAQAVATQALRGMQMLQATRDRIIAAESVRPALTAEGTLDREAFTKQVQEAAKTEIAYLNEVAPSGRITGMGSAEPVSEDPEKVKQSLAGGLQRLGLSESAAKAAV